MCLWALYWAVISQGSMVCVKIASKNKSQQNGRNEVSGTTLGPSLPWLLVPPGSWPGLGLAWGQTDRQRLLQTLCVPVANVPVPVIVVIKKTLVVLTNLGWGFARGFPGAITGWSRQRGVRVPVRGVMVNYCSSCGWRFMH